MSELVPGKLYRMTYWSSLIKQHQRGLIDLGNNLVGYIMPGTLFCLLSLDHHHPPGGGGSVCVLEVLTTEGRCGWFYLYPDNEPPRLWMNLVDDDDQYG